MIIITPINNGKRLKMRLVILVLLYFFLKASRTPDGKTVVSGGLFPDTNNTGYVASNRYNAATDRREQVGLVLYGVHKNICFGSMVDISSDCNIITIELPFLTK